MKSEHKGVGKQYVGCYIPDGIHGYVWYLTLCTTYVRKDQNTTVGL